MYTETNRRDLTATRKLCHAMNNTIGKHMRETSRDDYDAITAWMRMLWKVNDFIHTEDGLRKPSENSQDAEERQMATWIKTQRSNYAHKADMMKEVAI